MAETIPDRLVVLTFDDGNRSDHQFVAPLLERYGFAATFFITEGLGFRDDKEYFLTWEEVRDLHDRGFEIGNHTRSHPNVAALDRDELIAELEHIDARCRHFGIPRPRSFCYPGNHTSRAAVAVLAERGYAWARCRCEPTPYDGYREGGCGPLYDPRIDHPLLIPTSAAFGPAMDLAALTWAARQGHFRRRGGFHLPRRARSPPPLGVDRPGRRCATSSPGSPPAATPPSRCATWAATCRRRQRPPIPTRPGAAGTAPVSDHRTSGNSR